MLLIFNLFFLWGKMCLIMSVRLKKTVTGCINSFTVCVSFFTLWICPWPVMAWVKAVGEIWISCCLNTQPTWTELSTHSDFHCAVTSGMSLPGLFPFVSWASQSRLTALQQSESSEPLSARHSLTRVSSLIFEVYSHSRGICIAVVEMNVARYLQCF